MVLFVVLALFLFLFVCCCGRYGTVEPGYSDVSPTTPWGESENLDGDDEPAFDMFAQNRGISMSERMRNGPGYVWGWVP